MTAPNSEKNTIEKKNKGMAMGEQILSAPPLLKRGQMKKTDIMKLFESSTKIRDKIKSLKRRHVYCFNSSDHNDEPLLVTRFLSTGIRLKRLVKPDTLLRGYSNIFTLRFLRLENMEIVEVPMKNLPLYINRGTDHLKDLFRNLKKDDFLV